MIGVLQLANPIVSADLDATNADGYDLIDFRENFLEKFLIWYSATQFTKILFKLTLIYKVFSKLPVGNLLESV